MESRLEKEVRFLKAYAAVATLACAVFVLTAFTLQSSKQKFEEIDVERINIVEKDGKLKMVISNQERQHPGIDDGKIIDRHGQPRWPGILFFNERENECGGLTYRGGQDKGAGAGLSFDKFRQDQIMQLYYGERSDGKNAVGLVIWDRTPREVEAEARAKFLELDKKPNSPEKQVAIQPLLEAGAFPFERVWVGRGSDQAAKVVLSDPKGRARIRLLVDAMGTPKLEFLDETGKVTYSLPQESKSAR
jgi:hypothetical protein